MTPFFICHSPLADLPEGMVCGIYSAEYPRFFAEVYHLRPIPFESGHSFFGASSLFFFRAAGSKVLDYYLMVVKDNFDDPEPEELEEALKEAAEWYAATLSEAIGEVSTGEHAFGFAGDYNPALPGVRVLHPSGGGGYLVCHDTGVSYFGDDQQMLEFLIEFKGFEEAPASMGRINYDA